MEMLSDINNLFSAYPDLKLVVSILVLAQSIFIILKVIRKRPK